MFGANISSIVAGAGAYIYWNALDSPQDSVQMRNDILPERTLPLRIKYVPLYKNFLLECNITSTYVETEIVCPTQSNCAATRVRRSQLDHFPAAWTLLDLSWRTPPLTFEGMLEGSGRARLPQLFDRYLADPDMVYSMGIDVPEASEEEYTVRFGQTLNAFFTSLNGFVAITTGINNDTAYFWDNNHTFTLEPAKRSKGLWMGQWLSTIGPQLKTKAWSSDGTKIKTAEVMVAHRGWVIALCISSSVLILSSLIHPFIHHFLGTGVDIAMNISSLATRNNPHIPLPSTGTYLDASNRARLLSKVEVRFGDADNSTDIGSLAIGSFNSTESSGVARVREGRIYE